MSLLLEALEFNQRERKRALVRRVEQQPVGEFGNQLGDGLSLGCG